MPNNTPIKLDAVIIGGGIAGLFTLAKLMNAGYLVVLLEKQALGSGQTINSQGIIHGGTKYTLLGQQTSAQQHIAQMPTYWRQCLSGKADIDLSGCEVLTDKQCMWAMPSLSSKITGFFASRLMRSHVQTLAAEEKPAALQHPDCQGIFYALDEPVLNVQSLMTVFAARYGQSIITDCQVSVSDNQVVAKTATQSLVFCPNRIICTAGQGNADYIERQQIRPLRMVYAHVPKAFGRLFVHVLAASDKPRLTISTYDSEQDDSLVWYIGGNVAEKGANLSHEETIALAKQELTAVLPWLDFTQVVFDCFIINRAEGSCDGKRPDTYTMITQDTRLIAYPTKLALAPLLADSIVDNMPAQRTDADSLPVLPAPRIASYPWSG